MSRYWVCERGHRNDYTPPPGALVAWRSCPHCPPADRGPYRIDIYQRAEAPDEGAA